MKNKATLLNYLINQSLIKGLLVTVIIYAICGAFIYGRASSNTTDALLYVFTTPWSNIFILLVVTLLAVKVTKTLKAMTIFSIRMKTKRQELEWIAKEVIFCTILVLTIYCFLTIVSVLITHGFNLSDPFLKLYGMPFLYVIFFIIRYVIIVSLYALIVTLFTYSLPPLFSILLILTIVFSLQLYSYDYNTVINSLFSTKFYIGYYFSIVPYGSFFTEIFCSSFYIIILELFYLIMKKIMLSRVLKLNVLKVILKNDILALKNNKKKYLMTFLISIIIFNIFMVLTNRGLGSDFIKEILGLKIDEKIGIMSFSVYLLYTFTFLYLGFYLFSKDIIYQLDTYFLRMKLQHWYLYKVAVITILTIVIKASYYLIVTILTLIITKQSINLVHYFIIDIIFTTFLQQLLIYFYYTKSIVKLLGILASIILLIITGISIVAMESAVYILSIGVILNIGSLFYLTKNNQYMFFERKEKYESRD